VSGVGNGTQDGARGHNPDEHDALASLDKKLKLIDDRVEAVVKGFQTGFYLCGAGGLGKSYSVHRQLQRLECDFRTFNSRMTAKGLFNALERSPDAVHVLEDMERITGDRDAQGVLRSALWSQGDRERIVTWTTSDGERRFSFRGGLIMTANRPLADLPELRALATRIAVMKLEVTDAELVAHTRRIAASGWQRHHYKLEPEKAREVCEQVIAECRKANCPLDLRLLDNSCMDFIQWESGNAACHWKDLVANRARQSAAHFRHEVNAMSAEERRGAQRDICRAICALTEDPQERERLWEEWTGTSRATFFRRKKQVDSGEFDV
jgi:hypothetical protein